MRKGLTEVVFILDRSGSMSGLESDTIGGFNSMLKKQRSESGEAYISTVLFNTWSKVLYDRVPVSQVKNMTRRQYNVGGGTALLDAIGGAIRHISIVHTYSRDEDIPEKTIFIIITDGMENSSQDYSYDQVKSAIEEKKNFYGWEFLFLGANIDAVEVAGRFGINANRAVNYECDGIGTRLNYEVLSKAVSAVRNSQSEQECDEMICECCEIINKDYNARHFRRY